MWGAFTPAGDRIVTACASGRIQVFDAGGKPGSVMPTDYDTLYALAMSPDGTTVATGHGDGRVRLWRVPDLSPVRTIVAHRGPVHSVSFSHDGKRIASSGEAGDARIVDVATGDLVLSVAPSAGGRARQVLTSRDDRRLIVRTEFATHLYAIGEDELVAIACEDIRHVQTWPEVSTDRRAALVRRCDDHVARHPAPHRAPPPKD